MEIELKDFIILFVGFILGYLSNYLITLRFKNQEEKMIASYFLESEKSFFYEYQNGYGKKRFTKRGLEENYENEVSREEFERVLPSLIRRGIP